MEDVNSTDCRTASEVSLSSIENVRRKMILMKLEENEKSKFDDELSERTDLEPNYKNWNETDRSVTESEQLTKSEIPSEWVDQKDDEYTMIGGYKDNSEPTALNSYYQMMELNKEPIENMVRMARVPSQYQLDALSEMFLFDFPQNAIRFQKQEENLASTLIANPLVSNQDSNQVYNGMTPYFVHSEYVSEMLM